MIGEQIAWLDFHGRYDQSLGVYTAFTSYVQQLPWNGVKQNATTTYAEHYTTTSKNLRSQHEYGE